MAEETVEGLQSLLKSMDGLPLALQKNIIVRSLRKAGEVIRARAAEKAPDDPETPGSRIAVSMNVQVSDQRATGATALIGPSKFGFVGLFAEIGTAHQTAKPWLGPAFDETVESATQTLSSELGSQIETAWGKVA